MVLTPLLTMLLENAFSEPQRKNTSLGTRHPEKRLGRIKTQHPHIQHKIISQFDEIHLKDYDFNIHSHPAHKISDLEQLNVLNDLIGRIQDASSNSISNLVMNTKKESKIINLFSWTKTLKIVVSVIVGIALLLISIKLLTLFHPIPKLLSSFRNLFTTRRLQRDRQEAPIEMTTPMITMPSNSSTPNPTPMTMSPDTEPVHSHNKCTFVVGRGLVWEDLCPCDPTQL